jgi:hypothetical protein
VPAQYTFVSREVASATHQTKGGRAFPVRLVGVVLHEQKKCTVQKRARSRGNGERLPAAHHDAPGPRGCRGLRSRPREASVLDGFVCQTPDRCRAASAARFICLDSSAHCQSLRIQEHARTVQFSCESDKDAF